MRVVLSFFFFSKHKIKLQNVPHTRMTTSWNLLEGAATGRKEGGMNLAVIDPHKGRLLSVFIGCRTAT